MIDFLPWLLLAWILGIVTAIAYCILRNRYVVGRACRQGQLARQMNDNLVAKNNGRSELERRRQLHAFNHRPRVAHVVRLRPGGPEAA